MDSTCFGMGWKNMSD